MDGPTSPLLSVCSYLPPAKRAQMTLVCKNLKGVVPLFWGVPKARPIQHPSTMTALRTRWVSISDTLILAGCQSITSSQKSGVAIWEISEAAPKHHFHQGQVYICGTQTGDQMVGVGSNGKLARATVPTWSAGEIKKHSGVKAGDIVITAVISLSGEFAAFSTTSCTICVWSLSTDNRATIKYAKPTQYLFADGPRKKLICLWKDGGRVVDVINWTSVMLRGPMTIGSHHEPKYDEEAGILAVARKNQVSLWDLDGQCLRVLKYTNKVWAYSIKRNCGAVLEQDSDGTQRLSLRHLQTGITFSQRLTLDQKDLTFTPNGDLLISWGQDVMTVWTTDCHLLSRTIKIDLLGSISQGWISPNGSPTILVNLRTERWSVSDAMQLIKFRVTSSDSAQKEVPQAPQAHLATPPKDD